MSANVVPLTLGTETDTSIVGPARDNGIVGIKPTVGLTSRDGVIPISHNFDTVGPMARTVADVALGISAMVDPQHDYTTYLSTSETLMGARFGLPQKKFFELLPKPIRDIADSILSELKSAGAQIVPTDFLCADSRIPPEGQWDW